jgi:intracellular sulfur oxidation DsrE/DsrF family protein
MQVDKFKGFYMKNFILLPLLFLMFSSWAQTKPVKVVFDVTSKEEATHQAVMRHVTMMSAAYPDSEFEVVVYGGALPMLVSGSSSVSSEILNFKDSKNVSFKVCEQTMKKDQVNASQLLAGVRTVPDGILEIVQKQAEGWGYIKEAHD